MEHAPRFQNEVSSRDTNRMRMETRKRLFTADEYLRMGEAGILASDSRVELIEGEIIEMSPIGNRHLACVARANELFVAAFAGKAIVTCQSYVRLNHYSEPQPDLVLAKTRSDYYVRKRLSADDTFLVVEVADSSLAYDRKIKMPLYARSGVPEVWIEDLQKNRLLVYRNPNGQTYATSLVLSPGNSVSLIAFPDTVFSVGDLLLSDYV